MPDSRPVGYALMIVDQMAEGSVRDRTLPGGSERYVGHRHAFAEDDRTLIQVCRALGIGDDASVITSHAVDMVQVPVAPLRRARIDPILQYVNDLPVMDGENATDPLERLRAACLAAKAPSARAFLIRL
jgi:hypothetical protein